MELSKIDDLHGIKTMLAARLKEYGIAREKVYCHLGRILEQYRFLLPQNIATHYDQGMEAYEEK